MSTDTKVYIPKKDRDPIEFSVELGQHIQKEFKDSFIEDFKIRQAHVAKPEEDYKNNDYLILMFTLDFESKSFSDNKEHWTLHIFFDHDPIKEMRKKFIIIHMGNWGHNKEISLSIINKYGGFVDIDDSDDIMMDYIHYEKSKIKN